MILSPLARSIILFEPIWLLIYCLFPGFYLIFSRVIQHEYDHIQGILFTDKLSSFKKQLLKKKLLKISSGKLSFDYEMKYFKSSKKK